MPFIRFTLAAMLSVLIAGIAPAAPPARPEVTVTADGVEPAQRLQTAIDQLSASGGGIVRVSPGRYPLRGPLTLRSGVDLVAEPGKTILVVADSVTSPLAMDGDCNERQITLQNPAGFRVGDGVLVKDSKMAGGFGVTTARLTEQVDANTFKIDTPLYYDYTMSNGASTTLVFPAIGGWNVKNVNISGLTVEGNRDKTEKTDGCRSGGIYLFQCQTVGIRHCTVKGYNGDGISFQVSEDVVVEDCLVEGCAGLGLHPGSGSQRPIVRRNKSTGNGGDAMYVCWRVRHGLFENNDLSGNSGNGISIGHKDSDNLFRGNTIANNAKAGVFFRYETEPQGAHRNVFEKNQILDNNKAGGKTAAAIVFRGYHNDVVFRDNTIGNTSQDGPASTGIAHGQFVLRLIAENNRFQNVKQDVVRQPFP